MTIQELIQGLEYEVVCGELDSEITEITNDSRKAGAGKMFH